MDTGISNQVIIAVLGLLGTLVAGIASYRAGIIKTQTEAHSAKRDDKRDDFTVITEKYGEIITTLERQTGKQQQQIEIQDGQITKLLKERNTLKNQIETMISEIRDLKDMLRNFPDVDPSFITKINELHNKIVVEREY